MFRNGAPGSDRGMRVHPGAERQILLHQMQNPPPPQEGTTTSRTSPPVSRPAATAKPPQMNFGDGDVDQEGDTDDGSKKAQRKPEIQDEATRSMEKGYHHTLFMEAPPDEAGTEIDVDLGVEDQPPPTIRKERSPK